MKKLLTTLVLAVAALSISAQPAQEKYYNATDFTLVGKAFETPIAYHRVDTAKYSNMPKEVKRLYTYPAGVAVAFKTNSNIISAKWKTAKRNLTDNMAPVAQQGLDLYIKLDGKWTFAGAGRPKAGETSQKYTIIKNMEDGEKECLLYFPIYSELTDLEIGVEPSAKIAPIPSPFKYKVALYGSSIAHGAAASRPGMTYPSRMSRNTGWDVINLGISGNAKMEIEVGEMLADINPDVYILDCIPNPNGGQIRDRMVPFVKLLREKHPKTPIIIIQTIVRETTTFDQKIRKYEQDKMVAAREQVQALKDAKINDLYFIDGNDFIGTDHEATADGVHPTDLGFTRMIDVFEPQIVKILSKYNIKPTK